MKCFNKTGLVAKRIKIKDVQFYADFGLLYLVDGLLRSCRSHWKHACNHFSILLRHNRHIPKTKKPRITIIRGTLKKTTCIDALRWDIGMIFQGEVNLDRAIKDWPLGTPPAQYAVVRREIINIRVTEQQHLQNLLGTEQRYGKPTLIRPRLGQGCFRILVTDAYNRKCAVTGEKTLPVLEAAHIRPYGEEGPHSVSNGLLLRSDWHQLFDAGYVTISPEYRVEVSRRIREEFSNGRDYYAYDGQPLKVTPNEEQDLPSSEFLNWHRTIKFRS